MAEITRYTTPTITYTFSVIDVDNIATAFLTVKQAGEVVFEKALEDATVDAEENTIAWTMTQAETGKLVADGNKAVAYCDWRLADGLRGKAATALYTVRETGKDGVI